MPKYHTSVAQWGLVSGIRQEASDLIRLEVPPSRFSPLARKGQLLVAVEAAGDVSRGREACNLVMQTIHDTFYDTGTASITSGLRKAMQAANAALYQYNFDAPVHKRATVGVSSAVIQGTDLYLAQVPPTQAFVAHAGRLRSLPSPPSWQNGNQTNAQLNTLGALGTTLGSEPEFFRSVLQPGDTIVLCSTNIARLLSKQQAEELICFADVGTIAEGLLALCRRAALPEAHALVLEIQPALSAEAQQAPLSPVGVSERGKLMVNAVGDWLGGVAAEAQRAGTMLTQPRQQEPEQKTVAEVIVPVQAVTPIVEPAVAADGGRALLARVPLGDAETLPPSAFLGEGPYGGIVRPPAPKREQRIDLGDNDGTPIDFTALPKKTPQPPPSLLERATLPVRQVLVGALGSVANAGRRTRRPLPETPRQAPKVRGLSYRRARTPFPWLNVGLLVFIVVLLVVGGLQANRNRDAATVRRAIQDVDQAIAAARAAPDNASAQKQLSLAEANLKKIEPLIASGLITTTKSTWAPYQRLVAEYDSAMAEINQIGFFGDFTTLATLSNPAASVSRIVLAADSTTGAFTEQLYLMDGTTGTVYESGTNGVQPVLSPGDVVDGAIVGKLRELVWREDNPIALERSDDPFAAFVTVYLRQGGSWVGTKLQGTELIPAPKDMPSVATYGGNLYLWNSDAQQLYGIENQLMRYNAGRYADLPDPWLTGSRDPDGAKDVVSIAIDGIVYLLHDDGSVGIYQGGQFLRRLKPPELAVPIVTVQRFFVAPDEVDAAGNVKREGHIYLLDLQHERVIQIAKKDGRVIQQMQARNQGPLNKVTDLQVDEVRGWVYLANGKDVLRAPLPKPEGGVSATPSAEATSAVTTVTP